MNLELFCCSGGMAGGFRRAGLEFDLAFDADPDACASYERNLGRRPIRMDVRDLAPILRSGGWDPGPVDLLVADPPCTPWSRAGKRLGTDDERDMLVETCELIGLLRPRAYLIGNVPGLDDLTHLPVIQRTIGALSRFGYCTADRARLDAASFGVPQRRHRPFWFGHLTGPCIRWPAPTHGDPAEVLAPNLPGFEPLRPWRTCQEALGHLSIAECGRPIRLRPKYGNGKYWSEVDRPALNILAHETASGGHWLAVRPHHAIPGSDDPSRTITTKQDDGRFLAIFNSKHAPSAPSAPSATIGSKNRGPQGSSALEWPWVRPATTIQTDPRLSAPGHHDPTISNSQHGPNAVILSERAAAILQGFPDPGAPGGWFFAGRTKRSRWSQMGQAMPIALAEAVARSARAQMETTT